MVESLSIVDWSFGCSILIAVLPMGHVQDKGDIFVARAHTTSQFAYFIFRLSCSHRSWSAKFFL